ncbi:uncharacterized protein LOC116210969 isoform X1 [Punica granatum]|uniref:Uncharacterized protein LOC116210969 isoform X1 n=2 Tax=Punica granatum TaxID=22663 RepID=A0A6P8E6N3_PUNGR|nr:uncharacterized protein LOC116210969 isoform X1 [Punica granatum]
MKRFLRNIDITRNVANKKQESYQKLIYGVLNRYQSQLPKTDIAETHGGGETKDASSNPVVGRKMGRPDSEMSRPSSSDDEDSGDRKWRLEHLEWLSKALEPALQLCRWALPATAGNAVQAKSPTSTRSVSEIITSIQRSKLGFQDWSLSDLTVGLYLIYLRQASTNPLEDTSGVQISSDATVQDLIYHTELAKGAYKDSVASLARHTMLREKNVLKFVKNSNVLRPGYYIGIDHRKKLVIFGIRGTHTVYDLITDIVSSGDEGVTFDGYSTHFGTAEAARWFLTHEIGTIKKCLDEHKDYKVRLVGHSLGGATAALLAIMVRKKSVKQLGFDPEIVSAVGYATPPCVSRELAESCSDYVTTVVMQDDIIPRLSVASLTRLRNEILQTDWMSVVEKEDWKSIIDLVSNAKQVVSSVQDVAWKLADYAKFRNNKDSMDASDRKDPPKPKTNDGAIAIREVKVHEELLVPGTVYYLKRNTDDVKGGEFFTLWKRHPGDHFQRIVLSNNLFSDHKCDSHYYSLRDVLKGLPAPNNEVLFR